MGVLILRVDTATCKQQQRRRHFYAASDHTKGFYTATYSSFDRKLHFQGYGHAGVSYRKNSKRT